MAMAVEKCLSLSVLAEWELQTSAARLAREQLLEQE
jgi:hypothetical protein